MRRLLVGMIALASVVSITPGIREAFLDAAHWLVGEHAAHADACADGEGDEHGCTGAFHTCACHASPSIAVQRAVTYAAIVPVERRVEYARREARRGPPGHTRPLIRPPTA